MSAPSPDVVADVGWKARVFGSAIFFRLWAAQVVSAMGDWIGFLAIASLAARLGSGSGEGAIGLVMAARIVPGFFLASVGGVLVDRWDRKKVMVVCDLGRAVTLAFLPFVHQVWQLVVASLVLEVFTLLWSPAKEASVPNLVPPSHLTNANSLSLVAAYGTFPFASALFAAMAGLAAWLGGFHALRFFAINQESVGFGFDVLTFMCSALIIWRLPLPHSRRRPIGDGASSGVDWNQAYHELKEGWRFIFFNPVVRAVNVGLATGLIGGGMLVPLGPVFSRVVLGAGAAGFGLLTTSLGVGVAAGIGLLSVAQKRLPKARVFTAALFVAGGALVGAASSAVLWQASLFVGVLGICAGAVYVLGFTLLGQSVPDEMRGRIFSALYTLVRLCVLLSFALGPLLSSVLGGLSERLFSARVRLAGGEFALPGVRLTLWLAGLIILGAALLAHRSLGPGAGRPAAEPAPEQEAA
ncbi:MAG: hypothetical protein JWM05_202 [Acidimicrobiales bacterium]|nr:hypothetical protein [Acidimicrobiales bacterium]